MKKAIKRLKKEGAVISGDYDKLWHVIQTLKNQNENKKNTKDAEQYLVPLLAEKNFFKERHPMSRKDLIEVCNYAKYEVMDSGQTVFKQGDIADKCYIILKGQVCVQIPDPTGEGLVVPKIPVEVEVEQVNMIEEDDKGKILTKEELEALPPREQRKYKTRIMLQEILSSQNVKRSTVSLSQAINNQSQIADFVKLDPPTKPKTLAEKFTEKLQKAATMVLKQEEEGAAPVSILAILKDEVNKNDE